MCAILTRVLARYFGFVYDLEEIPPLAVSEEVLQVPGEPILDAILFTGCFLEIPMQPNNYLMFHFGSPISYLSPFNHSIHHENARNLPLFLSLNASCEFRFDLLNAGQAGLKLFGKRLSYLPLPLCYSYGLPEAGKRVFNDCLVLLFDQQESDTGLVVGVLE